ncbi:tape measure protein [Deinococcus sp. S9]|uniref:tape measure protein n=1 Tax=Deinococcus sp. S9 TaxID=2545754 RepID=UPI001055BF75|nr:tape measure protein [Deinococcus sp. S9]TDE86005.1 hypothetical protein E0686_09190 [Deinococcus sp. S9]
MTGNVDTLYVDVLARQDERTWRELEQAAERSGERSGGAFSGGFRRNSAGKLIDEKGRFAKEGEEVGEAAGRAAGRRFGQMFSEGARGSSQQLLGVLAGVSAAAGGAALGLVKLAGEAEQAQIGFTGLLGSAEKAKSFLADLSAFAANSPFDLKGVQDAARQLLSFGYTSEQVIPSLSAIGNAMATMGKGSETINQVVYAFGQMKANTTILKEDMDLLTTTGINGFKLIAEQIGKSEQEVRKMVSAGQLTADVAVPAMLKAFEEKFGGGMAAQAKSLLGMWSTTMDTLAQAGVAAGQAIVDALDLKDVLAGMNDLLGKVPAMLKGLDLKQWAQDNSTAITVVGGAIAGALVPALVAGASAAAAFVAPLLPFMAAGAGIVLVLKSMGVSLTDVRAGFEQAGRALSPVRDTLLDLGRDLQARLMPVFGMLGDMARAGIETVKNVFERVFLPIFEALAPHVRPLLQAVGSAVMDLAGMLKDAFMFVQGVVREVFIPVFEKLWPVIGPILSGILDGATVVLNTLGETFRRVGAVLRGDWASAFGDMQTTFEGFGDKLDQAAQNMAQKVIAAGKKLGTYIWEGLQRGLDGLQAMMQTALANALSSVADKLPGFLGNLFRGAAQAAAGAAAANTAQASAPAGGGNTPTSTGYAALLQSLGVGGFGLSTDYAGHRGKDVRTPEGTALRAPGPVKVQFGFQQGGYGQFLQLTQEDGSKVVLAHLKTVNQDILNEIKRTGYATVGAGTLLGTTGGAKGAWYSQNSTGPHLHAEILAAGANLNRYLTGGSTPLPASSGGAAAPTPPKPTVTQQPKTNTSAATPSISSVFGGGGGTPTAAQQKEYNLTLSDWNKLKEKALDLERRHAQAVKDGNDATRLRIEAEMRAWAGDSKVRQGALAFAKEVNARMAAEAERARQEEERRDKEALQRAARVAEAARQGNITLAQQEYDRLEQLRQNDLRRAGDSAAEKAKVEKRYAQQIYDAAVAVAEAKRKDALRDAANGDPKNRAQAELIAQREYDAAVLKAQSERNARLEAAEQAVHEAALKRARDRQALQARIAQEARALRVGEAEAALTKLKELDRQELASFKGTAEERLALVRRQSQSEFDAAELIARVKRNNAIREAENGSAQNRAARIAAANAEYENTVLALKGARLDAVRAAQEGVTRAQAEWRAELEAGAQAGQQALETLSGLNLGGRELAAQARPIADTTQTFTELLDRLVELRGELATPGVAEAWTASIEELGRRGELTAAQVAALTAQIKDLQALANDGPLLPDNLQGRGIPEGTVVGPDDPATGALAPGEYANLLAAALETDPDDLRAALAAMERAGRGATELAGVYRDALAQIDAANAEALSSIAAGVDELGNTVYLTEDQIRGIGVASDEASEPVFDLANAIANLDQFDSIEALNALIDTAGLAEEDAQALREAWQQQNAALLDLVVGYDEAGNAIYKTDEQLRGIGVTADDVSEDFFDLENAARNVGQFTREELERLIETAQLTAEQAEVLRNAWADVQMNVTLKVQGFDTGVKVLDIFKSAVSGVSGFITDTFQALASGSEVTAGSVVKSFAAMALGVVKSVAVQIAAIQAAIVAEQLMALVMGIGTFNPVKLAQAAAITVIAAAVAGIAAGLEARLTQKLPSGTTSPSYSSSGTSAGSTGGSSSPASNNLVTIPSSQVQVIATPGFVATFGGHVDRFGAYVDRLIEKGVLVRASVEVDQPRGSSLGWELGTAGI